MRLVDVNTGKIILDAPDVALLPLSIIEGYLLTCNINDVEWQNV